MTVLSCRFIGLWCIWLWLFTFPHVARGLDGRQLQLDTPAGPPQKIVISNESPIPDAWVVHELELFFGFCPAPSPGSRVSWPQPMHMKIILALSRSEICSVALVFCSLLELGNFGVPSWMRLAQNRMDAEHLYLACSPVMIKYLRLGTYLWFVLVRSTVARWSNSKLCPELRALECQAEHSNHFAQNGSLSQHTGIAFEVVLHLVAMKLTAVALCSVILLECQTMDHGAFHGFIARPAALDVE